MFTFLNLNIFSFRFISGDALKIISKIMNSPFNALTVFTKFMSSPTDALEIISKIVSSPQDVLQFIKNLMDSPENAMDIMNKFINTPAEALRMLNQIFNGPSDASQKDEPSKSATASDTEQDLTMPKSVSIKERTATTATTPAIIKNPISGNSENTLIHSMLNYPSPNEVNGGIMHTPIISPTRAPLSLTTNGNGGGGNYVTPPLSVHATSTESLNITSPIPYHSSPGITSTAASPSTLMAPAHDELPSTSSVNLLSPPSEVDAAAAAEFASEHFDIKNSFLSNASSGFIPGDSLNSLESVLTEVIRIEFQAFNNLPPEPRVKHEHLNTMIDISHGCGNNNMNRVPHYSNINCMSQQQQAMPCQPTVVCSPSTSSYNMSRDLNESELMKLRELKLASEALYLPVDDDLSVLMSDDRIKVRQLNSFPLKLKYVWKLIFKLFHLFCF